MADGERQAALKAALSGLKPMLEDHGLVGMVESLMEWMPPSLTASRCAKLGVLWPERMEGGIHEGS